MIEPIVLTEIGETLVGMTDSVLETDVLTWIVGQHVSCRSMMRFRCTSTSHFVINCSCGLRVTFPTTVQTYKDLREYFANRLGAKPETLGESRFDRL